MEESIIKTFGLKAVDIRTYSPLTLAYIGDGVYELIIRNVLVRRGNAQPHKLHVQASNLVKAKTQARLVEAIEPELSDEEKTVLRRGRNAKPNTIAKNASANDYHMATGFEAVIGYLYLKGRYDRIMDLIRTGFGKLNQALEDKGDKTKYEI